MKFFVWPLCDEYYLGEIWNIDLQNFLNVMKTAQLINKCNFHDFCRPLYKSKNYEICFSTLNCQEKAYIKFWGHLEQVHFELNSKLIQKWIKANPKC